MRILRQIIVHLVGVIFIFFLVVLLRYPALVNADYFLSYDEAFMAVSILEVINGGPLFSFYEGANYHGVLGGVTAIPFMRLVGIGPLGYKLPTALFYSLYIWSTFLIMRQIAPRAGLFVILVMLFPPDFILGETLVNHPHTEICFIGNILLLLFIKIKTKDTLEIIDAFFLSLVMGFAIYTYTYAVLHVFTILIASLLTYRQWTSIRQKLSVKNFFELFKNLPKKKYILVRVLDVVILMFTFGILFSYVFGGFGLDFGGNSIFQINKLHKPVFQLMIILGLRLCIRRDDLIALFAVLRQWLKSIDVGVKRSLAFGGLGFCIGLSPRIFAILAGDIRSGGQGFDIDFVPDKLVFHFLSLITQVIPQVFGVYQSLNNWGSLLSYQPFEIFLGFISLYIFLGIILSLISVFSSQKENLLSVFKLKKISFDPMLILIIFSILTLVAVVISQSGPLARYLYPLFGVVAVCLALVLDKIRQTSPRTCLFLVLIWVGFHSCTAYAAYSKAGVVDGLQVVRLEEHPLKSVIRYLQSKSIKTIYTSIYYSSVLSFLSNGEQVGTEYNKSTRGKKTKALSNSDPNFAILIEAKNTDDIRKLRIITEEKHITFETKQIRTFFVFFEFTGDERAINELRSFAG